MERDIEKTAGKQCGKRGAKKFRAFFSIHSRVHQIIFALEFYEDRHVQPVLSLAKIRIPGIRNRAVASGNAAEANQRRGLASVASRRRKASPPKPGEIFLH
jgi:hypothetical protein